MDDTSQDRRRPSINFTHLADRLLIATGTMPAFRHTLESQNKNIKPAAMPLNGHMTSSRSVQFSEQRYVNTGMFQTKQEVTAMNSACAFGYSLGARGKVNGFMTKEHVTATKESSVSPPSTMDEMSNDSCKISQRQMPCNISTESVKADASSSPKQDRPKARPSRPPLLPPCRVCGDRASGFHYGVNTCEACKGFFRRSINKTPEPYVCVGNGRCKLVPGKRTACSACRYQRCLEVGMSKSAIKTGRYTHELRSKNIMEVKMLQMQNGPESVPGREKTETDVVMETEDHDTTCEPEDLDMEELSHGLVQGQKKLHEFLDDYYNEELMRSRQMAVYDRYIENKRHAMTKTIHPDDTIGYSVGHKSVLHPVPLNLVQRKVNCASDVAISANSDKAVRTDTTDTSNRTFNNGAYNSFIANYGNGTRTNEWAVQRLKKGACAGFQNNGYSTKVNSVHRNGYGESHYEHRAETSESGGQRGTDQKPADNENEADCENEAEGEKKKAEVLAHVLKDMEKGVRGMLSFSQCLPGFEDLPKEDQATLLKASRFDIWYIGHIRCFNTDLRVGACEWQFHAEELEKVFTNFVIYRHCVAKVNTSLKVWGENIVDLAFRLSRRGQELDLSKEETAALRAVCLSFPDRCYPLTERDTVEAMHDRMVALFRYVSSKRHRKFNAWFPKVIDFLTILRDFGISFEKESNCLKLDWSVLHENPYLLEVFLS